MPLPKLKPEHKIAILSAAITAFIGLLTVTYMHRSYSVQIQQLEIEREKLKREREKADLDRAAAVLAAGTYRQQLQDAHTRYTATLGSLIEDASREAAKQGESNLVPAARALVASRNGLRSSLESIHRRLNSELDDLERELQRPEPRPARVAEIVQVLQRKWPAKKVEIELAVRKLFTELGLTERR